MQKGSLFLNTFEHACPEGRLAGVRKVLVYTCRVRIFCLELGREYNRPIGRVNRHLNGVHASKSSHATFSQRTDGGQVLHTPKLCTTSRLRGIVFTTCRHSKTEASMPLSTESLIVIMAIRRLPSDIPAGALQTTQTS